MYIFEVVRWGNDGEDIFTGGANGPDTCFLVLANTYLEAADLVDAELGQMPRNIVANWAQAIYHLGSDAGTSNKVGIIRGPYIEHAYRYGWKQWLRHEQNGAWSEST